MYQKAEPLYGAPRGNRVMAAKRVKGPSAKVLLDRKIVGEKCRVAGCFNRVLVTKNPTGVDYTRHCADHVGARTSKKAANVRKLLSLGAYQTGEVR